MFRISRFRLGALLCVLVALFGVAAWGQVYEFTFAHAQPLTHPRHISMQFFESLVEEASQGRIQVELFGAGVLGDESALMDMVKLGTIQGTRGGAFQRASNKYLLITLPFLFASPDEALAVVRSDFGQQVNADSLNNGFYVPALGLAGGFRQITNVKRPIEAPGDLVGLKIRAPGIESIIKTMEALGATVASIPYTETYMGLKTGVADGQENPYSNIVAMKFYEVQEYMTIVNYQVHPDPFFVNPAWYEGLPDDLKAIFDASAKATMAYSDAIWLADEDGHRAFLETVLTTNVISEENRPLFIEQVKPVWQYFIDNGYFTQEEVDEALAIAAGV
jgi:tripartite ATP-independent transporter DctP family solute receptor